jgi:xylulokinase
MASVTVGLDIGTTSVKAVAVDDDGAVLARARVPHRVVVPAADRFEHDADQAWRRGPRRALAALGALAGDAHARGVGMASMVPSMTAVDRRGRPLTPGLLYGDARGRDDSGEVVGFLRWTAGTAPEARGYWPAGAVAVHALGGAPAVDLGVALTSPPLFGAEGWDPAICAECGARPDQMPSVEMPGTAVGRLGGRDSGPALAAGSVDVWCEQMVAGAGTVGDVHVICGTTLIVWAVVGEAVEAPGLWTVQHATPGQYLVGGASNAGGLFLDWAGRLIGRPRGSERVDPADVPVWTPYARGERTPYHDPDRRAGLHDLALTHGPAAVQRAAWEASAFVARHHLDLAAVRPARIVATGGGTRIAGWMQALADATGLPVHVAASPEGAARGAAFLARLAAGLESDLAEAARWASTGHIVEPDGRWEAPTAARYRRFVELSGPPAGG